MKWRPRWIDATTEMLMPYQPVPREWLSYTLAGYVFAAQFARNKVILDVACGSGYGASYLLSKGAQTVFGGDRSRELTAYATAHYGNDRLHVIRLDAAELPFQDHSLDLIVSCETIEHLAKPQRFLDECRRALKIGGVFICRTPNRRPKRRGFGNRYSRFHVQEFNAEQLHHLLADRFDRVTMYGQALLADHPALGGHLFGILPFSMLAELAELAWRIMPFQLTTRIIYSAADLLYHGHMNFVKVEELDGAGFEGIVDEYAEPYLLEEGSLVPGALIGVAT